MNMIVKAADAACRYILATHGGGRYLVFTGYSSEKRPAGSLLRGGKGKKVVAGCTLPAALLRAMLRVGPAEMVDLWRQHGARPPAPAARWATTATSPTASPRSSSPPARTSPTWPTRRSASPTSSSPPKATSTPASPSPRSPSPPSAAAPPRHQPRMPGDARLLRRRQSPQARRDRRRHPARRRALDRRRHRQRRVRRRPRDVRPQPPGESKGTPHREAALPRLARPAAGRPSTTRW